MLTDNSPKAVPNPADTILKALFLAMFAVPVTALLILAATLPSLAAEPGSTVVDATPFVQFLIDTAFVVLAPAFGAVTVAVLAKVWRLLGMKENAEVRDAVDQALDRAVTYARARLKDHAARGIRIDTKSEAVATAAGYAMRSIPDTLKRLGITDAASDRLREMVESRLEGFLVDRDEATGVAGRIRPVPGAG